MAKYHYMYLKEKIFGSPAHNALVEATANMEPKPVYAKWEHVPVMVEECAELGGHETAAEEVLASYFATPEQERDLRWGRHDD